MLFTFLNKKITPDLSFLSVDMHSHLLPGIDDGLQTPEQTVEFIKALQVLGYNKFICTPHILPGVHNNSPETILPSLEKARKALAENGINIVIEAAAEYMIDDELEQYLKTNKPLLTFGKNYMLIEMSYVAASPNMYQVMFDLRMKNIHPILAHPERYSYYHQNFQQYVDIRERDVLFQVNLLSLAGYYGPQTKRVAVKLIKEGMVEFIGTDIHHPAHLKATQAYVSSSEFYKLTKDVAWLNNTL